MLPETGVIPHTLCAGAPGSEPPETVSMQHSENTRLTERTACLQKQLSPGNLTAYHPTSPVHAQYETVHLHTPEHKGSQCHVGKLRESMVAHFAKPPALPGVTRGD